MPLFKVHDVYTANWPIGLRRIVMSKRLLVVSASVILLSVTPSFSWAQGTNNPCPCVIVACPPAANEAQSNRRFSYEPMPSAQSKTLDGATIASTPPPSQPNVQSSPTQNYRRFSYQPTQSVSASRSRPTDQPWRYSKTDPRRYR